MPAITIYLSPKVCQMQTPKQLVVKMYSFISTKVINETDDDVTNKIATHSYQGFAFYFKRITIGNYNLSCDKRNGTVGTVMYVSFAQTENSFYSFFNSPISIICSTFFASFSLQVTFMLYILCVLLIFTSDVFLNCKLFFPFLPFWFSNSDFTSSLLKFLFF